MSGDDRVRPSYPPPVLPLLCADLAGHRVADVAVGTGKLTAVLSLRRDGMSTLLSQTLTCHSAVAVMPAQQRETVLAAVRRLTTEHPDLRGTTESQYRCISRAGSTAATAASSQVMTRIGWPETVDSSGLTRPDLWHL